MAAKRKAAKKINVRIGKRRKRSHSVGSTHRRRRRHHKAAAPKRRRRKSGGGFLGATGGKHATLKQIAWMAVGVAAGAGITHVILRPIEQRLAARWPMVAKFLAAGEVLLGGIIAVKGKTKFVNALGVGILAGGVHGLLKQANVYKNLPHVSDTEMSDIRVPISGSLDNMLAGILEDGRREVHTNIVAGLNRSNVVAETDQMAGIWDDVYDSSVKM